MTSERQLPKPKRDRCKPVGGEPLSPRAQHYERIARDRRYSHFIRIPARMVRCLDYFGIEFDRKLVTERLRAYYLFIGVIDDALDSRSLNIGKTVLEIFDEPRGSIEADFQSTVEVVTTVLRSHTTDENHASVSAQLRELYGEVLAERTVTSIDAYIAHRKAIGSRTADLSYVLIEELLQGDTAALRDLVKEVGVVGCLVDSVIDLNVDGRAGLLGFTPSRTDRLRLATLAISEGAQTLFHHPALTRLFAFAIADNIGDRFRARDQQRRFATVEQNNEVTGVI